MKFYMLDGNEKILCAVPSKDIISLYQNLNYHQADTIEGSLVLSEKYTSILNNVRYFAISDRESNHNFYLYRKTLVQVQNHEIAINGQGAFWDEIQGAYIKDKRPNQVTPADTIKLILSYSRWNVDYVDQMLEEESLRRDMNFYYVSLLDALNTVYQTWQVDIEPYINIEGHQITRRYVKLYQQQGGNNGRRFVYGDNALTVTQQANEGSIFTALVGRGAGVEETDASGNLTGGYSRKINFADVEWSKANGDPCDKPKGQEYVEWKESTELYGYSDGKPRIGIVNFDNEKDPVQLLKETWAQLQQVGVPLVQFQATVGDVGYLNLGETVTIVRYDLNIKYQTRVTGIKWNRCDEAKSQITIGVKAIQSTADKIAGLQQSVAQANVNADEAKSTANHAIIDGTGAVVNYGPNEPTNPKEGDIWYDVQPDGTVVLKQYQNGQWVILIDDTTGQQIKNKVEAQQKELDKAVQDANAASAKADGLVAQVGDANTNAQKALSTAQQNQADLAQAKNDLENTKNQLTNVQSDLTGTKSSLAGAISNISQAQEDLKNTEQGLQGVKSDLANDEKNLSDLTKQAQTQGQTIVDIQKTQSGLSADIADVKGNVSSLKDTANDLQATVKDNQGNISKLQDTANSLQSSITDNKNNIANIKQTAGSIQSTVASMQNAGENLIVNSDFEQGNYHWNMNIFKVSSDKPFRNHKVATATLSGFTSQRWNEISTTDLIPVTPGQTISIGVWVKTENVDGTCFGGSFGLNWYANTNSGRNHWDDYSYSQGTPLNHDWQFLKMEGVKAPSDSSYVKAHFFLEQNGTVYYALPIMVYGDKLPTWSPSPLDSATATDMSSVEQTVNGLKSTVQSNKGDISTLKQTASGLESDVQNNKNSISTIKQSADKVQSIVSNMKVGGTNLLPETQNYTGYIRWGGTEIIDDYSCNDYQFKPQTKIIHLYQTNGNHSIDNAMPTPDNKPVHIIQGKQYTFSAYVWHYGDTGQANELVTLYANNGNSTLELGTVTTTLTNQAVLYHFTFTATQTGDYTRFRVVHRNNCDMVNGSMFIAEMKLEEGNVATDWSPSPYDMASQDDLSSVEQTVSGLTSTVQSNSGQISQVKQTIDSIQSTVQGNTGQISQVKQTADSLQSSITQGIGSYLPNGDFADSNVSKYWVPWDTTKDLSEVFVVPSSGTKDMPPACLKIQTKSSENKTDIGTKDFIPININEPIEIKAWSRLNASNGNTQFQFYIHCYDENHNPVDSGSGYFKYDNLNEWELTDVTFGKDQWNKNTVSMLLEIVLFGGGIDTVGCITDLKIINGSSGIASEFTQTIDSLTSKIADADGNISQLKQTSDSLTSQIGNANSDISSLKQRADSMESNISDNKNDISDLKQTASSLQSNIQSKTDISQFTQLSNAFQTVVQNIGPFYPDGDFSDTDLSKYYDPWDTCTSLDNFSVVTNNSDWGYYLQIYTPQGTINKMITKEYLPINANYPITFKGKSLLSYDGELKGKFQVYYHFYDSNKNQVGSLYVDWYKYDNNNVWQDFSSTLTPPSGAVYLRIETVLDNSEGSGTYWGALDNLSIENGEATIASKISQMADDINMRVQKGDLLSQINIQAGSTLIQSNKLYLDASSVVFSGNAFIPSAAITDLSADKITAGTLNAYKVNVINLDVNKLVGDTTEFVRSGWTNAYGSHVQIDGGGMSITYGDWLTKFEPDGMVFRDGNEDIGGFTRIGMQNAPSWYSGLAFNAGGDAEFLSIGAKDYHNDSQNPVPAKLLWMRHGINTYGYNSGWNFCDDVWAGQVGMSSIQYGDWNIHFEKITGNDGFSALTLVSGSGDGFYWGSDGSFGYVTNHGGLHNVRGSQIVYDINQNGGTCQTWSGVD